MARLRMRLGTLMLLVLIAALSVALLAERRRSAKLLAEMRASRDQARVLVERAMYQEAVARVQALSQLQAAKDAAKPADPAAR